ncbi:MAG: twin-arginine translocase TatA/TatE family subunit [Enterobacteriaceae bacterium]
MLESGMSVWQLLIIAVIVVVLFGTNKLRTLGSDLGASIKGFKKAIGDDESARSEDHTNQSVQQDADFETKSLQENSAQSKTEPSESKNQDKPQV